VANKHKNSPIKPQLKGNPKFAKISYKNNTLKKEAFALPAPYINGKIDGNLKYHAEPGSCHSQPHLCIVLPLRNIVSMRY